MPITRINMHQLDIDFSGFDYERYYTSEQRILIPQLKCLGYTLLTSFADSERDTFGPLGRSVRALDHNDEEVVLWYG